MDTSDVDLLPLVSPLLEWYGCNKRILPWRSSPTPYHVWISEIMLQQTRVDAVKPYYERFLKTLPDVKALAEAEEQVYLKLWEGLGYYSRVRNLHKAAIQIQERHDGVVPSSVKELLALSGVGSYTAGAIASIAYGMREPAVDGNVLRILSRVTGDPSDILLPQTKANAERKLKVLMEEAPQGFPPGDFNQALMDLGATICIPNGTPLCAKCPLSPFCTAYQEEKTELLPVRIKKTKRRIEERTVFLIQCKDHYAIQKRPEEGLLGGLFELPNVLGHLTKEQVEAYMMTQGYVPLAVKETEDGKHIFSHVEWRMKGYHVLLGDTRPTLGSGQSWEFHTKKEMEESFALPSAFRFLTKMLQY